MSNARENILRAARDLLLEGGEKAMSMRAVAARVGLSATAIYRHWRDKEALFHDVILESHKIFSVYLFASLEAPTPLERLRRGGEAYVRFALERRQDYQVMFMTPCPQDAPPPEELARKATANYQLLVDRIQECADSGALRPGDANQAALTVWALCHGLVSLQLTGALGLTDEAFLPLFHASCRNLLASWTPPEAGVHLLQPDKPARAGKTPRGAQAGKAPKPVKGGASASSIRRQSARSSKPATKRA